MCRKIIMARGGGAGLHVHHVMAGLEQLVDHTGADTDAVHPDLVHAMLALGGDDLACGLGGAELGVLGDDSDQGAAGKDEDGGVEPEAGGVHA
ncbi:hypothetical protein ABT299_30290 [Spirillospora sp. NPDC000708]